MNLIQKILMAGSISGIILGGCKKEDVVPVQEEEEQTELSSIYENIAPLSTNDLSNIESIEKNYIYFT